jgi:hypothetical protein
MKFLLTKSPGAHEDVFAVQVGNEAAYSSQQSEVRVAREDCRDHTGEKNVGTKIQNQDPLENRWAWNKKIRQVCELK